MAVLNFNAHAVVFESGLDTIEQGYAAAVAGIAQEINRKKAAYYDYVRHVDEGGDPTEERDEDGRLIWSRISFFGGHDRRRRRRARIVA